MFMRIFATVISLMFVVNMYIMFVSREWSVSRLLSFATSMICFWLFINMVDKSGKWDRMVAKIFRWGVDADGDLVLSIFNFIHVTKYKGHTIIRWGRKRFRRAPKYVG